MEIAATALADAGFIRQRWPFGSTFDPATRKNDEMFQRVHAGIGLAYARLDAKTIRFYYPDDKKLVQRTILIPRSYLHLAAFEQPSILDSASPPGPLSQPPFYAHDNLYYPNVVELLRSIIKVYLEEREYTDIRHWQLRLSCWAFGYLYGELQLRDDVLDTCDDEMVKECFNQQIKRGSGRSRVREK
ncbi:hypothetical protein DL98DRAFT_517017 [Cadophora sp. DSE1049]|nr:hypothetical protein DL98DRAFT_517017 [Cadophora sp. DSE1049]